MVYQTFQFENEILTSKRLLAFLRFYQLRTVYEIAAHKLAPPKVLKINETFVEPITIGFGHFYNKI